MPTDTPSAVALAYVAPRVRFSLRAITIGFVFSRASDFNRRTSSFVHGRSSFGMLFPLHQWCQPISDHHNAKRPSVWTTSHSNIRPDNALPVCQVSGIESSKLTPASLPTTNAYGPTQRSASRRRRLRGKCCSCLTRGNTPTAVSGPPLRTFIYDPPRRWECPSRTAFTCHIRDCHRPPPDTSDNEIISRSTLVPNARHPRYSTIETACPSAAQKTVTYRSLRSLQWQR
jgi:hypothetical protein